ncbi:MAG: hypothetical protein Q4G13_09335 [Moraxella sp.]|nr:hypothetical protein [Moraxella sp.]
MKKIIVPVLLLTLVLSACNKTDNQEQSNPQTAETTHSDTHEHDEHASEQHGEHEHEHDHSSEHEHEHDEHDHSEHAGHDHSHADGHNHAHTDGTAYSCDNNKTAYFDIKDNEGQKEALLTLDSIAYDLHPNSDGDFVSNEGIQDGTGMIVKVNGNTLSVNTWSAGSGLGTALMTCQH